MAAQLGDSTAIKTLVVEKGCDVSEATISILPEPQRSLLFCGVAGRFHTDHGEILYTLVAWHLEESFCLVVPLSAGSYSIGREPNNAIQLPDPRISRHHCTLEIHADGYMKIDDNGSANGTFVGSRKCVFCELTRGSQVIIGETLLMLA